MLPGAMAIPPSKTQECIKKMIAILEHGTPVPKERWIGHPSILLLVFGPSQYLVTPPIWMTKPKLTSKPLPALSSISKLALQETRSKVEDHQKIKLMGGGNARRLAGTDVALINHFM